MEVRNVNSQGQSGRTAGGRGVSNGNSVGNVPVTRAVSPSMLANMEKGSIFSGDIIDVRNSFIKILLDGNHTIMAKATNNSNLNIGDYIRFMIKDNTGSQVLIKALNVDNSHTNPLLLALKSANIPITEDNMKMVSEMMRNEMPIDINSINEMYKNIALFENSNPKTIVNLIRHDIPLNESNIEGYERYINYEHRLMYELADLAEEIPSALENILKEHFSTGRKIFYELINVLPDGSENEEENINIVADENIFEIVNDVTEASDTDKSIEYASSVLIDENPASGEIVNENVISIDEITKNIMDGNIGAEIDLNEFIASLEFKIPKKEFLLKLTALSNDNQLETLLKKELTVKYLKTALLKNFSIDVNKIGESGEDIKKNIKALYEKLNEQTKELTDTFKNYPAEASTLIDKLNGIRQNLSFMNEINQMASYVQLPIKFSEGVKHGELYVYNKNHGKPVEKDVLTAFMHLDMDNLGATDIDIRLEGKRLSANFEMTDDISASIVEKHLEELKSKLTLIGFNVSVSVKTDENQDDTPFEKLLEIDRPKMSIKRFSFDVRA